MNMTGAVLALVAARQAGDTAGATRIALFGALMPNPLTGLIVARMLADQDTGSSGVPTGGTGTTTTPTVRLVQVPAVEGDVAAASGQLTLVGLRPVVVHVAAPRPAGAVIGTDPRAGVAVPVGTSVTVEISDGMVAPDLVGETTVQATAQLEALGLVADVVEESRAGAPDIVLDQFPDPGLPIGDDRRVVLVVRAPDRTTTKPASKTSVGA